MSEKPAGEAKSETSEEGASGESFSSDSAEQTEKSTVDQVKATLVLIPVLGVLWFAFHYLPQAGDWIGDQTDQLLGAEDQTEAEVAEVGEVAEVQESVSEEIPAQKEGKVAEKKGVPKAKPGYSAQIVEQLGGPDRVEVRYLALSDDFSEMVVSLKLINDAGEGELLEVFFDRDKFGRYLSAEDSPVPQKLTLWTP